MNFDYKQIIPQHFDDSSRVWIYQSSHSFNASETSLIENILKDFVANWQSHGISVKGYAQLIFNQFIILMADETATGVSGCSTDSSVRVIKQVEDQFGVSMFDRQTLAFLVKDKIHLLPLGQISYAFESGYVSADTLYFNNLVSTKKELLDYWIIPMQESWLASKLNLAHHI